MTFKDKLLNEFNNCNYSILNSTFENFLAYKNLFQVVHEASNNLEMQDYKEFCNEIGISQLEARNYCIVYEKLFNQDVKEYKISDELIKRAKSWDKSMWIEFSKIYNDDTACRKNIFLILVSGKFRYNGLCIPVNKIKLSDIKRYRLYINKFKRNKKKKLYSNYKSLRTRLNNFINKEFKNYAKADKQLLDTVKNHSNNLLCILEEHLENLESEETENKQKLKTNTIEETIPQHTSEKETTEDNWYNKIERYTNTDIYKLYSRGENLNVKWENPYYAVIFLGLDIFKLPNHEEYRKKHKELVMLFHPDNKPEEHKVVANLLTIILNDINLNTWGISGERYNKFVNSIKFSLMKLKI